jgi:hypothetical protein
MTDPKGVLMTDPKGVLTTDPKGVLVTYPSRSHPRRIRHQRWQSSNGQMELRTAPDVVRSVPGVGGEYGEYGEYAVD